MKRRNLTDDFGQRIQAFAGCAKAAGGDAKMATYFLHIWSTHDFRLLSDERLSRDALYAARFLPDGQHVAVAGAERSVQICPLTPRPAK